MWQQESPIFPFNDPRMYPQLHALLGHSMFEDKIETEKKNNHSKLLLAIDDSVSAPVEEIIKDENLPGTSDEHPKPYEDITENSDCIFNDLRQERYAIQHQDLL